MTDAAAAAQVKLCASTVPWSSSCMVGCCSRQPCHVLEWKCMQGNAVQRFCQAVHAHAGPHNVTRCGTSPGFAWGMHQASLFSKMWPALHLALGLSVLLQACACNDAGSGLDARACQGLAALFLFRREQAACGWGCTSTESTSRMMGALWSR